MLLILFQTPHHVQIYFYTLCLKYIFDSAFFECSENAGVWLPPSDGFDVANPSLLDIKSIDLNLLSSPLDLFIFRRLPLLLAQRRDQVQWHFNPSCKACKFAPGCERNTIEAGLLGVIPNLSVGDAQVLKDLLQLRRHRLKQSSEPLTEIEELHTLVQTHGLFKKISSSDSSTVKKARRLLAIPRQRHLVSANASPIVEAAVSQTIQVCIHLTSPDICSQ